LADDKKRMAIYMSLQGYIAGKGDGYRVFTHSRSGVRPGLRGIYHVSPSGWDKSDNWNRSNSIPVSLSSSWDVFYRQPRG